MVKVPVPAVNTADCWEPIKGVNVPLMPQTSVLRVSSALTARPQRSDARQLSSVSSVESAAIDSTDLVGTGAAAAGCAILSVVN